MTEKRNCPICGTHYVLRGNPEVWQPACDCEQRAVQAEIERRLIDRARGPLDASFAMLADQAKTLGEHVARRRRELGLSQTELGALVGRSESWVSQVERGARHVDRLSVLQKLREVLGDDDEGGVPC